MLYLALQRMRHAKKQSLVLCLCLALVLFLPLASHWVTQRFEASLRARAARIPLLLGASGNQFDLSFGVLSHRDMSLKVLPWRELERATEDELAYAIPFHRRFRARGRAVVGTSIDYFERMGLRVERGTLPQRLGDCVLGHTVASELGLGVGDKIFSDPVQLYDLSKPPALRMRVVGVLGASQGADDTSVFVDIKTAWLLEGLYHGHADADAVEKELVLGEGADGRRLSTALMQFQEVTDANRASFHLHGDPGDRPLSAALVVPRDLKAATMLKSRVKRTRAWQMVEPEEVVAELMEYVVGIQRLVDAIALMLAISTALLLGLVFSLSMRIRASETRSLVRIGVGRAKIVQLWLFEFGLIFALALALAIAAASLTAACASTLFAW